MAPPAMPSWDAESKTVEFPPSLAYLRDKLSREVPVWSPGLCATGNTLQADGRRVVNTEAGNSYRCVSTEVEYRSPGKYLFMFAIEAVGTGNYMYFGVRTASFRYGPESKHVGQTQDGWAYYAYNGSKYNVDSTPAYAQPAGAGDVIGMLLDLDVGTLSFLKNGRMLGVAFTLPADTGFFPVVSTCRKDQSILTLCARECGDVAVPSAPRWDDNGLMPFPHWMSFCQGKVTCVTPEWSPGLCAPGNTLDMDGRRVVKTEAGEGHRCVSTDQGCLAPGKYLFAFAIEDTEHEPFIMFGVRTLSFTYGSSSVFLGSTADGWAYCSGDGKLYHRTGEGVEYAEDSAARGGDVIGMLLDLDVGTLSFLKNNRLLGIAHCRLPTDRKFFPCVSTRFHGASVVSLSFEGWDMTTSSWSGAYSRADSA